MLPNLQNIYLLFCSLHPWCDLQSFFPLLLWHKSIKPYLHFSLLLCLINLTFSFCGMLNLDSWSTDSYWMQYDCYSQSSFSKSLVSRVILWLRYDLLAACWVGQGMGAQVSECRQQCYLYSLPTANRRLSINVGLHKLAMDPERQWHACDSRSQN